MFTGSIDLEKLPERMEYLCVSQKYFCGSLDLWSLPKAMTISMNDHKVSGNVDFTRLPAVLVRLSLSANQLSGGGGGEMVEWLVQGYVHSVATSIPAHAV